MDLKSYPGFIESLARFETDLPSMRSLPSEAVWGLSEETVAAEILHANNTFKDKADIEFAVMIRLGRLSLLKRLKVATSLSKEAFNGLIKDLQFWFRHSEVPLKCSLEEVNEVTISLKDAMNLLDRKRQADLSALQVLFMVQRKVPENPYQEALEEHAMTLKMARLVQKEMVRYGLENDGAFRPFVLKALEAAKTYCWSKDTVEAVATGARKLGPETKIIVEDLGLLGRPGSAGFFWFTHPIPIATTANKPEQEPVAALLWLRDKELPVTYFATLVISGFMDRNRSDMFMAPTPSQAWSWTDGDTLEDLESKCRRAFKDPNSFPVGQSCPSLDVAIAAEQWFTKFFLVSAEWLQQRITVAESGHVERHARKRVEREVKRKFDAVTVISLRRRNRKDSGSNEPSDDLSESKKVNWSCRWWVDPFPRNQWYPALKVHRRIWIDGFWKGPDDAPVKEKAKVYAVVR